MKYKHINALDWLGIKSRIKDTKYRWGGSRDIDEQDKEDIKEAQLKEATDFIEAEKDILSLFRVKQKDRINCKPKLSKFVRGTEEEVMDKLRKIGYKDNLYGLEPYELAAKYDDEIKKLTRPSRHFSVQKLLDFLKIKYYSIPYGESRAIENNHDGEVLAYVVSKTFKSGFFIAKTKRKVIGFRISTVFEGKDEYRQTKIMPIPIQDVLDGMRQLKKGMLTAREEKEHKELIKKSNEKEKEIAVEKEI